MGFLKTGPGRVTLPSLEGAGMKVWEGFGFNVTLFKSVTGPLKVSGASQLFSPIGFEDPAASSMSALETVSVPCPMSVAPFIIVTVPVPNGDVFQKAKATVLVPLPRTVLPV
jgi:hypothetical protein